MTEASYKDRVESLTDLCTRSTELCVGLLKEFNDPKKQHTVKQLNETFYIHRVRMALSRNAVLISSLNGEVIRCCEDVSLSNDYPVR